MTNLVNKTNVDSEMILSLSNEPAIRDKAIEEAVIRIVEDTGAKVIIENLKKPSTDNSNFALIVLCPDTNVEDRAVLNSIALRYYNNQHIVLYKPTNREINTVYRYIEGKDYFSAEQTTVSYSLFGLKLEDNGINYILECHDKLPERIAASLVDFLEKDTKAIDKPFFEKLIKSAKKTIRNGDESEVNLAEAAKCYVITQQSTLAGKPFSLDYYMYSCHVYDGDASTGGEDWFFIQQYGILNGAPGYDKHWAGTRINVNGESWYVGQGDVALNYVDYYKMTNYINTQNNVDTKEIVLIYAEPQAINGVTSYTISESESISGTIGFEGGKDGGAATLKGNGFLSIGAGFESSYSFEVADCTCEGRSLEGEHPATAAWKYTFKRAQQNRSIGKWQHLHDPAKLATSVFSPLNTWIWKFPTDKRDVYKQFESVFEIGIMNTISRYSGSQSPKDITGDSNGSEKFTITLKMPPLLCVNKRVFLFSNECSSQTLEIACQGSWSLQVEDANDTWVSVSETEGKGQSTKVYITVDKLEGASERSAILQVTRIKDKEDPTEDELIQIKVFQSTGKID